MVPSELASGFSSMIEDIRDSAGVETVFGDPIERGDRTVVPVARVVYGFGGGSGGEERGPAEGDGEDEGGTGGYGEGAGGGVSASPVGALEVTDDETRFVRFQEPRRAIGGLLVGLALGYLLGKLLGRRGRGGD